MNHVSPTVETPSGVIRRRRREVGLTQMELAQACGCSRRTIIRMEAGETKPLFQTRFVVASILGVEPSDLLEGDE